MKKTRKPNELPSSLKTVPVKALLRKRGIYLEQKVNRELKEAARSVAREFIKGKKKKAEPQRYLHFTNEEALGYWQKQVRLIEVIESKFENKVQQFVMKMVDGFLSEIDEEITTIEFKKHTKGFFEDNTDELLTRAQLDFTPLLVNQAVLAGQEALKLIKSDEIYLPELLRKKIAENVAKFTQSMIDTDRETLANIITQGLADGKSVGDIRNQIQTDFREIYSKSQAERVTRTEVSRVSNQASLDAWEQSGQVEGKQWVTFGAVDECLAYDGQIVSLSANFYGQTDEFADGDPPLHPNCKCGTVPILI